MGKVVKIVGAIAGAIAVIATGGAALGVLLGAPMLFGGVAATAIATVAGVISTGLSIATQLLGKKPRQLPGDSLNRLYANFDLQAPRKLAFGKTAFSTDIRYQAYTGTNQEYLHWIVACAAHSVHSIDEIWFDSVLAWSATGGVTAKYTGYLEVAARTAGSSGNAIPLDSAWTSSATLSGCAYVYLRYKLTGNTEKAASPFASSIPTRMTIIGEGMPVPDMRVGPTDPEDQNTWPTGDPARNPAWQLLAYLIGWRINGKVSVGRGVPVSRIDLDSFITAANLCDEPVTLAVGGTEPRYRADGVFTEADAPEAVIGNLCAAMNAVIRDASGRLALHVVHNDLSNPMPTFTEDDILGEEVWRQTGALSENFNVVRGRYVDATQQALYQLVDYPEVALTSPDGIDRIDGFDLALVQSAGQAQRLAKQRLQRAQYQGSYTCVLNARAWQISLGDPVKISHSYLGWDEKLFRLVSQGITVDGRVPCTFLEEHEDIYAWDAEEAPAVEAAEPTTYDPLLHPWIGSQDTSGALAGQLLWDDTFDPAFWILETPAERVVWGPSRSNYAANIPIADSTDVRVYYETELTRMPRSQPGEAMWLRVTAIPDGIAGSEGLTFGGIEMTFAGDDIEFPLLGQGADFDLEVGIDWLDENGDFISRSIVQTLDASNGRQTAVGYAIAPALGYARPSFGYSAQVGSEGIWSVFEPWMNEHEPTADSTAENVPVMTLAGALNLYVTYDGTLNTPMPVTLENARQRGAADVSPISEWTATFPAGMTATINNTPDSSSRGDITITGFAGTAGGKITVTSTRDGTPLTGTIDVNVSQGSAPSSGGSTGGTGGTTSSDSSITFANSASYGTENAGPMLVETGSAATITFSAPLSYLGPNNATAAGKWQWRVPAGVWADATSEAAQGQVPFYNPGSWPAESPYQENGYISIAGAKSTGLSANTQYEVRLLIRSPSADEIYFWGTATAVGS